jgi:hypothetical protein
VTDWAEVDKRIDRLEKLVLLGLCKCRTDHLGNRYFNNCPLHDIFNTRQSELAKLAQEIEG